MRYHLEKGKRRKGFSFIIAKDYFSFPAFATANNEEHNRFPWGKGIVKVSLLFAQITAKNRDLFCKRCLVSLWSSKVLSEGSHFNFLMQLSISSKTIPPPRDKQPGHDLKGAKTLPPGQSLCTKTLSSGQNRVSKAPPPGHKVRKFHECIYKL